MPSKKKWYWNVSPPLLPFFSLKQSKAQHHQSLQEVCALWGFPFYLPETVPTHPHPHPADPPPPVYLHQNNSHFRKEVIGEGCFLTMTKFNRLCSMSSSGHLNPWPPLHLLMTAPWRHASVTHSLLVWSFSALAVHQVHCPFGIIWGVVSRLVLAPSHPESPWPQLTHVFWIQMLGSGLNSELRMNHAACPSPGESSCQLGFGGILSSAPS